jgi:hypothetical protein
VTAVDRTIQPLRACGRCGVVLADDFGDVPNPGACAGCADRAHERHLTEERTRRVLEMMGIDPAAMPGPLPRRVTVLQTTNLEFIPDGHAS